MTRDCAACGRPDPYDCAACARAITAPAGDRTLATEVDRLHTLTHQLWDASILGLIGRLAARPRDRLAAWLARRCG